MIKLYVNSTHKNFYRIDEKLDISPYIVSLDPVFSKKIMQKSACAELYIRGLILIQI